MLPEQLLELLGLPPDATIEDVLALIASLQLAVADAAADVGADETAAAAEVAAEATEDAADAAAAEEPEAMAEEANQDGDDDEEKEVTAAEDMGDDDDEKVAASVAVAALKEVRRLSKRLDARDRVVLMNSVSMTPRERKFCAGQTLSVVSAFVKTCSVRKASRQKRKPALGRDGVVVLTTEDLKLCSMTGISPDEMREARKLEIMKGRVA